MQCDINTKILVEKNEEVNKLHGIRKIGLVRSSLCYATGLYRILALVLFLFMQNQGSTIYRRDTEIAALERLFEAGEWKQLQYLLN